MSSTKESERLLPPTSSPSSSSNPIPWIYNRSIRYGWTFIFCVLAVLGETLVWRRLVSGNCGLYCSLNAEKENVYFKYANELNSFDYAKMPNLQYPAGVLYAYKALNWFLNVSEVVRSFKVKSAIPIGFYFYLMFCSAYLMKRCRIPAGLMVFFIVPLGVLLQGHALMFILPEMLGITLLLQCLVALIAGYQRVSMVLLAGALSFDTGTVLPLLPALMLCLMRTMGMRCSFLWMSLSVLVFTAISGRFLLTNPSAYIYQSLGYKINLMNPIHWILQERINTVASGIALQSLCQVALINSRWLRNDGGILGLATKFMKSTRGHGIRPNPWTPRQTLTVIFESMLISGLLRFPSLLHASEFPLLPMMISGFFCVALAEPVPVPALFGIFTALSFPLSFLYRQFEDEFAVNVDEMRLHQFLPKLVESLHFLPMLLLPLVQLAVLSLFNRKDICGNVSGSGHGMKSPTVYPNHRRSSSLSRRKID